MGVDGDPFSGVSAGPFSAGDANSISGLDADSISGVESIRFQGWESTHFPRRIFRPGPPAPGDVLWGCEARPGTDVKDPYPDGEDRGNHTLRGRVIQPILEQGAQHFPGWGDDFHLTTDLQWEG